MPTTILEPSPPVPSVEVTVAPTASVSPPSASPSVPATAAASVAPTATPGSGRPGRGEPFRLGLTEVAHGIERPDLVTNAGDDRLFVVGQFGTIHVIRDGVVRPAPFLDITPKVTCCGEDGLLGLAFHPDYTDNGRFFITYVGLDADTVLAEYRVDPADPDRADPASERVLMKLHKPFRFHWGGNVAFGPDGYLYFGTGDGGHVPSVHSDGDPHNLAQNTDNLLGKILRIDVDSTTEELPYGIPVDNPFVGRDGRDEIWAYGLRNPWRWSIDPQTHDLWIGDVGHSRWEEIDHSRARGDEVGGRGVNYGWRILEGDACYKPAFGCDDGGTQRPIYVFGHGTFTNPARTCAVVGGAVYRGPDSPALRGSYLFGDFCSGRIWSLPSNATGRTDATLLLESDHVISSFGVDSRGEMYLCDLAAGTVYQLSAEQPR